MILIIKIMEILSETPDIKKKLASRKNFDLCKNNEKLGIIDIPKFTQDDELKNIFEKILSGERIEDGYYYLNNLLIRTNMENPDQVAKLIVF